MPLILTADPVSPVSPFLPFFPRLPGGPGGPAMNNKRKLINSIELLCVLFSAKNIRSFSGVKHHNQKNIFTLTPIFIFLCCSCNKLKRPSTSYTSNVSAHTCGIIFISTMETFKCIWLTAFCSIICFII